MMVILSPPEPEPDERAVAPPEQNKSVTSCWLQVSGWTIIFFWCRTLAPTWQADKQLRWVCHGLIAPSSWLYSLIKGKCCPVSWPESWCLKLKCRVPVTLPAYSPLRSRVQIWRWGAVQPPWELSQPQGEAQGHRWWNYSVLEISLTSS